MQNVLVNAVGKYKEKFNQTGLLIDAGQGEFWANFPGALNWKDYKDKRIDVELTQDGKGYWSGTIGGQGGSQGSSQPRQAPKTAPRDYDKENIGKCVTQFIKAYICSGVAPAQLEQDATQLNAIFRLAKGVVKGTDLTNPKLINQTFEQQYDLNDPTDPNNY